MLKIKSYNNTKTSTFFPIVLGLISGISVFYFLYFFEAYGIQKGTSYSGHSHLFRSFCFGIITFVYLAFFEFYLKKKFAINAVKQKVFWYVFLVFFGSQLIFLLFNYFWNWQEWNLQAYLLIIKEFPLMMIIPIGFYLILSELVSHKKIENTELIFQSENNKDRLKIKAEDFLYALSSGNYITVSYASENSIKEHLIRKTLKLLEKELEDDSNIKRCHRSYLVNTSNIQAVKQEKGKVFIEIKEHKLPVSKQYQEEFLF
ncbi:LytTR family transcriptional regulator DNA-binding domain-containing protein [uncultured Tenacibaculum sp.]|uniref:LytR/AlgR family response regulator transcription factor n=1 Tax=uncultured Tenacibaculum sp. TaxID=174713 RepID=UPI002607B868|nr:LytTR family transcriptional regulator DNA-binding domain-containing protein [uncultured Tenacibaculum sp.]